MKGELCGFLDAGDTLERNYIQDAVTLFKNNDLIGVSQTMKIIFKNKIYYTSYKEKFIDITSSSFNQIGFASTIFLSHICKSYTFDPTLKYSQDRHFLNYLAINYHGTLGLINSRSYVYNQVNEMKVRTTF